MPVFAPPRFPPLTALPAGYAFYDQGKTGTPPGTSTRTIFKLPGSSSSGATPFAQNGVGAGREICDWNGHGCRTPLKSLIVWIWQCNGLFMTVRCHIVNIDLVLGVS